MDGQVGCVWRWGIVWLNSLPQSLLAQTAVFTGQMEKEGYTTNPTQTDPNNPQDAQNNPKMHALEVHGVVVIDSFSSPSVANCR